MRRSMLAVAIALSACTPQAPPETGAIVQTPAPNVVVVEKQLPAPPPKVVVVEKTVPAPPPQVVVVEKPVIVEKKVFVQKPPSPCKGLKEAACGKLKECIWIKHSSPTDKHGRPLTDYCRLSASKSAS